MRLYNIASGTLLILPIIGFALAAPVQVQENSRAGANVVHAPRDVITVLGKRMGGEEIEKIATIFGLSDKSVGSSDAHVSSSSGSASPEPNPVDAQPPPPSPGPESSTANQDHGSGEPNQSPTAPKPPLSFDQKINQALAGHYDQFIKNGPNRGPTPAPGSATFDDRMTASWDKHYDILSKESSSTAITPAPNPESSTVNPEHGSVGPSNALSGSGAPVPGSHDDRVNGMWTQRYGNFLKNSPNQDNRF